MLFIVSIIFGPKKGAIAGAVGMGLFDLVSGWTLWAPFTIVARLTRIYRRKNCLVEWPRRKQFYIQSNRYHQFDSRYVRHLLYL